MKIAVIYALATALAIYGIVTLGVETYTRIVQHDQMWAYLVQVDAANRAAQEKAAAEAKAKPTK